MPQKENKFAGGGRTIRVKTQTYELMGQLCKKGLTHAEKVEELFQYRYAKEIEKLNATN